MYSRFLLISSALSISFRAIFMMYFAGMTAVTLYLPTGEIVPMYFDPPRAFISAISCSLAVVWAFHFASQDEHWNGIIEERRKLAEKIYTKFEAEKMKLEQKRKTTKRNTNVKKNVGFEVRSSSQSVIDDSMLCEHRFTPRHHQAISAAGPQGRGIDLRNHCNATRTPVVETHVWMDPDATVVVVMPGKRRTKLHEQITILFDRPWRIIISGMFVAFTVLAMHYLGIHSIYMQVDHKFDMNIVLLSVLIALVAATAAMFILFRVIPYYRNDTVKVIGYLIIAFAVNGMHYAGMAGLQYTYAPDVSFSRDGRLDGLTFLRSIVCVEVSSEPVHNSQFLFHRRMVPSNGRLH
ncbi:hypothetical protein BJ741DRAFT_363785 [Chytriomyces cf. hyalinus JEL632]|nr:hypothetical protein BJ741DRAFT_363785 [Chytriomyces cf. hyalinus JEL632]